MAYWLFPILAPCQFDLSMIYFIHTKIYTKERSIDMAKTTLKQCAEAFEEREDVLKILMRSNPEYFDKYSSMEKNEIVFENQGLDMIEELASDKDKVKVTYQDIADVLGVAVGDVAFIVKKNEGKVFSRLTTKAEDGNEANTVIRCKEIETLVTRILSGSRTKPSTKVKPKASTTKTTKKTSIPAKAPAKTTTKAVKKPAKVADEDVLGNTDEPIKGQMSLPELEDMQETIPQTPVQEPAKAPAKSKRKKATKGALTKSVVESFGKPSGDSKSLRQFLLSGLNYKLEDVALMSDDEITKIFNQQAILETPQGTIVVEKSFLLEHLDKFLFIPKEG